MTASDTHRAVDAVWRMESAKIIGALTRLVRDIGLVEELAQDALVAARWPGSGAPENPGAWLTTIARRRAIDQIRRAKNWNASTRNSAAAWRSGRRTSGSNPTKDDDVLRLMFTTCHPALSTDARVALTLRLLGGLTTDEIARAFLVPESTVAQVCGLT
jgi:RNA polymerase sigma factor (sigma-70 family)